MFATGLFVTGFYAVQRCTYVDRLKLYSFVYFSLLVLVSYSNYLLIYIFIDSSYLFMYLSYHTYTYSYLTLNIFNLSWGHWNVTTL